MAFLPDALGHPKVEFSPILSPGKLKIGEGVYSFSFFSISGVLLRRHIEANAGHKVQA